LKLTAPVVVPDGRVEEQVTNIICDICKKSCKIVDSDYEYAILAGFWGYFSEYDLEYHECHICPECYEELSCRDSIGIVYLSTEERVASRDSMLRILCSICSKDCWTEVQDTYITLSADWGDSSKYAGEKHECLICEECYEKLSCRPFVRTTAWFDQQADAQLTDDDMPELPNSR